MGRVPGKLVGGRGEGEPWGIGGKGGGVGENQRGVVWRQGVNLILYNSTFTHSFRLKCAMNRADELYIYIYIHTHTHGYTTYTLETLKPTTYSKRSIIMSLGKGTYRTH